MDLPTVNWAVLQQLSRTDVPERTVREVAHRHGLDLPHQPGILPARDRPGRWLVHCIGCSLQFDRLEPVCRLGYWTAPAELIDAEPVMQVARALDQAHATAAARPERAA